MSAASGLPRLLAELLGVEAGTPAQRRAAADGADVARAPGPPTGAPVVPARPAALPRPTSRATVPRERVGRRPGAPDGPVPGSQVPPQPAARPRPVPPPAAARVGGPAGGVAGAVRATLASTVAMRRAVVVAELLGPPRALRPYGQG